MRLLLHKSMILILTLYLQSQKISRELKTFLYNVATPKIRVHSTVGGENLEALFKVEFLQKVHKYACYTILYMVKYAYGNKRNYW